jgi:hypothetical protein
MLATENTATLPDLASAKMDCLRIASKRLHHYHMFM